jgi:hypothetical protein
MFGSVDASEYSIFQQGDFDSGRYVHSSRTMPHGGVNFANSILSILSCDSDRFSEFCGFTTEDLVKDARRIISHNRKLLRKSSQDLYRLDELLLGMLDDAPDPSGSRYVAVVLYIAHDKGSDAVVEAGKAWLDYLYFPS